MLLVRTSAVCVAPASPDTSLCTRKMDIASCRK
jgi:hypothetical protein